jgi:hypothetical protein
VAFQPFAKAQSIIEAILRARENTTKAAAVGESDTAHRGDAE